LNFWIILPQKKENPNFIFFQKLTEFMEKKKALLASFYLDCTVKRGGGGRAWVWSNTHARVFFGNFATPSTLWRNGQPQILSPHKPLFLHLYVLGVFGLDEICRAGLYFVQNGQITRLEILLKAAAAQGRTGWNSIYHQPLGPATPPALGRRPLPFTR
jgi:hypothetical protein